MNTSLRPATSQAGLNFFYYPLLFCLLLLAPIFKGGNRPIPLLMLEMLGMALLFALLMQPSLRTKIRLNHPQRILIGCIILLPIVQLLPLPEVIWERLPGRFYYAELMTNANISQASHAISLIPLHTEAAFLALLPPIAVFLTTLNCSDRQIRQLSLLMIVVAFTQSIIGLAQFGSGNYWVFGEREAEQIRGAFDTYANPDHLAGFLEMALPLALAQLFSNTLAIFPAQRRSRGNRKRSWKVKLQQLISNGSRFNQLLIHLVVVLVVMLGLTFTHSRAGLSIGILTTLVCAAILGRQAGRQFSRKVLFLPVLLGMLIAAEIGLMSVASRFSVAGLTNDYRWSIYTATLKGIMEFLPMGSGLGSYPEVFRRFQPPEIAEFVNHAHNDYLELIFEAGLPAIIILLGCGYFYFAHWKKIWPSREEAASHQLLRLSAGVSLAGMALHELFDFNLHIPANAIYFGFVAGIFFHRHRIKDAHRPPPSAHNAPRRTRLMPTEPEPCTRDEIPNPFLKQSIPGPEIHRTDER